MKRTHRPCLVELLHEALHALAAAVADMQAAAATLAAQNPPAVPDNRKEPS